MILKGFTVTDSPFLKLNQLVFMVKTSFDILLTCCLTFKKNIFSADRQYPNGVPCYRRHQNLWLWILPGNWQLQTSIQQIWDTWICCSRNCSPRACDSSHWYLVSNFCGLLQIVVNRICHVQKCSSVFYFLVNDILFISGLLVWLLTYGECIENRYFPLVLLQFFVAIKVINIYTGRK